MINSTRPVRCYKCGDKTINAVSVNNPLGQDWCPMCDVFTVVDNTYRSTFQGSQSGRITRSGGVTGTIGKAETPWGITPHTDKEALQKKEKLRDDSLQSMLRNPALATMAKEDPDGLAKLCLDITESILRQNDARDKLKVLLLKGDTDAD